MAEEHLRGRGFVERTAIWEGILDNVEDKSLSIRVRLPAEFPGGLPEVFVVNPSELGGRIAHVEQSGKVCVAPATGILIDVENPVGVLDQTMARAASILADGISGRSKSALQTEFVAYWADGAEKLLSICSPEGPARKLALVSLDANKGYIPWRQTRLVAESVSEANAWVARLGGVVVGGTEAFFVPLQAGFDPPGFGQITTVMWVRGILRECASESIRASLSSWLSKATLPASVIFSLPLNDENGRVLAGLRFEPVSSQAQKRALPGFRQGKAPAAVQLQFAPTTACKKLILDRVDAAYVLPRGGAGIDMRDRSIAIVGCGAVGSFVAQNFASMGIGEIRLVDPEAFEAGNCHRHVLGVRHIGANKAKALVAELDERYPHQRFFAREERAQDVLAHDQSFLLGADLIVFALGDETLERRLNEIFRLKRTIHVWLDPLGLGGHVLVANPSEGPGCYECLFKRNSEGALYNAASFAAPGQVFQRSLAGCAGLFTPFSNLDAVQTACIATRVGADSLRGTRLRSVLVSWFGERESYLAKGFSLSQRAALFTESEQRCEFEFAYQKCAVCAKVAA
jgi:molybdopterin/thiamine biosynthesis adenylyltransferase